jgi:hypothetical protein
MEKDCVYSAFKQKTAGLAIYPADIQTGGTSLSGS